MYYLRILILYATYRIVVNAMCATSQQIIYRNLSFQHGKKSIFAFILRN